MSVPNRKTKELIIAGVVLFAIIQAALAYTIYYKVNGDSHDWINLLAPRGALWSFGELSEHGLLLASILEFAVVPVGIAAFAAIAADRFTAAWYCFLAALVFTIGWQAWGMWNVVYGY
jgi:hypothetical protein